MHSQRKFLIAGFFMLINVSINVQIPYCPPTEPSSCSLEEGHLGCWHAPEQGQRSSGSPSQQAMRFQSSVSIPKGRDLFPPWPRGWGLWNLPWSDIKPQDAIGICNKRFEVECPWFCPWTRVFCVIQGSRAFKLFPRSLLLNNSSLFNVFSNVFG